MNEQREYDYVTIFSSNAGKDGQGTLRFNNVTMLNTVQDKEYSFSYVSASTGDKLTAYFPKSVFGISLPEIN
jgi:hypothetical protein